MAVMLNTWHDLPVRCLITAEFVGDEHARDVGASLRELSEELLGCHLVPAALHEHIKHVPVLIDGAPKIVLLAVDLEKHFVG